MMVTNVNAGTVPAINTAHYSSPLTTIALAAGRLFRPKSKEIQAIDEQLNSIIMNPEGIGKAKLKPAEPVVEKEPIVLESIKVEKVQNYKEVLPLVEAGPEMKEIIEDVKEFAIKYKSTVNLTPDIALVKDAAAVALESPVAPLTEAKPVSGPASGIKEPIMDIPAQNAKNAQKDPLVLNDDLLAKLKQSAKIEVASSAKDIRRDMLSEHVTCDYLESELTELSLVFKKAAKKSARKH
ncbi:MAG TPA: hypothetical protein VMC84_00825 [Methanocella sp.]|uniref:hypothetical protein n=1 Tax=Methanocella sp. TaxID=2052833 RepID=UPI002C671D53|nr:hypothetical protein [Methanocella sp.]HTY89698.1 hypothetical protein [Methanocella sp.]